MRRVPPHLVFPHPTRALSHLVLPPRSLLAFLEGRRLRSLVTVRIMTSCCAILRSLSVRGCA